MSWLIFNTARDLLTGLHCASRKGRKLFPKRVLLMNDGRLALTEEECAHYGLAPQGLQDFCGCHGVEISTTTKAPEAREIGMGPLLAGMPDEDWTWCDPSRMDAEVDEDHEIDDRAEDAARAEIILGAAGHEQAGLLLRILNETHVEEMKVCALSGVQPGAGIDHLWRVRGEMPLAALEAAPRAWWGPVKAGMCEVFQPWRWRLNLPRQCLERIDWGARLVLLGRREPPLVVEDADHFRDLTEVGRFHGPARADLKPAETRTTSQDPLEFPVTISLAGEHPSESRKNASRRLGIEIQFLQALKAEVDDQERHPVPAIHETLCLYPSTPLVLHDRLRGLMMGWPAPGPEGNGLFHTVLDGPSLGGAPGKAQDGVVHVVTSLMPDRRDVRAHNGVGLRLREWRPDDPLLAFTLAPEWAVHGLFIFLPGEGRLALSDKLPPSKPAALKLASALLGREAELPLNCHVLLLRDGDGVKSVIIPHALLRPLDIPWRCKTRIDTIMPRPPGEMEDMDRRRIDDSLAEVAKHFEEGVDRAFNDAMIGAVLGRMKARRAQWSRKLQKINETMEKRAGELKKTIDQRPARLKGNIDALKKRINGVSNSIKKLSEPCKKLEQDINAIQTRLMELRADMEAIDKASGQIHELRDKHNRLEQECQELINGSGRIDPS